MRRPRLFNRVAARPDAPSEGGEAQTLGLTGGLQRVLVAIFVLLAILGGVMLFAVRKLDDEVARWSLVERIDETRAALLIATRTEQPAGRTTRATAAERAEVFTLFDTLEAQVDSLTDGADAGDRQALALAQRSTTEARGLYDNENDRGRQVRLQLARVEARATGILQQATHWRELAKARLKRLDSTASEGEEELRQVSEDMVTLGLIIVEMGQIQKTLDAMEDAAFRGGNRRSILDTNLGTFLPQCAAGSDDLACGPRSRSLRRALAAVDLAGPDQYLSSVTEALWQVDMYVAEVNEVFEGMALQMRGLADQIEANRDEARALFALEERLILEISELDEMRHIARVDTVSRDLSIEAGARMAAAILDDVTAEIPELLRDHPFLQGDPDSLVQSLDELERDWNVALAYLMAQRDNRLQLVREMSLLADTLHTITHDVRQEAEVWVGIFGSSMTVLMSMMAGLLAFMGWASRKLVMRPLKAVVGAIGDLSAGRIDHPVTVSGRVFGFDRIGEALEDLRLAMEERAALSKRTQLQQIEIEENLHALEETTREMEWQAMHDALTTLPNRRAADRFLAEMARDGQGAEADFCLIHVDLDRFKQVNDTLGHEAGDAVLTDVSATLRRLCGRNARAFRIGGDEFLVAWTHGDKATTQPAILDFAESVIEACARPIKTGNHLARIGASLGIAWGSDAELDPQATLVNADLALYEAKNAGRNAFRVFEAELQQRSRKRQTLANEVLEALDREEFVPVYQPQFYADGLKLRGVETLCRWKHPQRGWVPPGEFLDCAEELKVIGRMDQQLFRKAAKDLEWLRSEGLEIPKISFNVSADRLLLTDLADSLVEAIDPRTRVAVELLESMSLDSLSESVRWSIDNLKEKGVEVEIDDFGSCRASIAGLIAVGPDAMKIDGAIIKPLIDSDQHLRLVRAIVEIGQALDIEVVAEGVETQEHVDVLRAEGCTVLQGFALARPMLAQDLAAFLREWPQVSAAQ